MNDPMNTTALEGAACALCGDDATGTEPRIDTAQGPRFDVPTCDRCHDELDAAACADDVHEEEGRR